MKTLPDESCDQTKLVELYALGALPSAERDALADHLKGCAICRRRHDGIARVLATFRYWPGAELSTPKNLWSRLERKLGIEPSHAEITVSVSDPAWEEPAPGIYCKILSKDEELNRVSMLVRLDPGVEYPPHSHAGVEVLHLLDGELWIDERKLRPGDYNRAEPGTRDKRVWSETGCTCILITSPADELTV
jgi:anti-sigma factor ChrR (cupin superfamily)